MTKLITFHAYRGGTGTTTLTANVAACVARYGYRVGVLDLNWAAPGLPMLFGFGEEGVDRSLQDYIQDSSTWAAVPYDVSSCIGSGGGDGKVYLIPGAPIPRHCDSPTSASPRLIHLTQPQPLESSQIPALQGAIATLSQGLKLDYLFLDTPSGFGSAVWQTIAPSQVLLLILRPDQQDYPGTALSIQLAQHLQIPRCFLVVNPAPKTLDSDKLKAKLEDTYGLTVAGVLPLSTRMVALASSDLFVTQYPDHPLTHGLEAMARLVML
ncbi:MAG: MinD/ParA family ATP-binding protein [Prochlorothrix sp.]